MTQLFQKQTELQVSQRRIDSTENIFGIEERHETAQRRELNIESCNKNQRESNAEVRQRRPNINIFGDSQRKRQNSGTELIYLKL